jgi:hypothetical protein
MTTENFRRVFMGTLCLLGLLVLSCAPRFPITGWPIDDPGSVHEIGNNGGEFQQYSGDPYFHAGIDILADDAPSGPWVRTVREGNPTLTLIGASSLYNGLTISHSDGDVYQYWHLDFNSISQAVRDAETDGTALAANSAVSRLVTWTACSYHHLHYEMTDSAGKMDPIYALNPRNDTTSPIIINVSFVENTTNTEFPKDAIATSILSGDVDIIAHAYDQQFGTARTGVMNLSYWVNNTSGTQVKAPMNLRFRNIPAVANASIIFRNVSPFDSDSNYCGTENYFYVLTNADANGNIISDASGFWDTSTLPNGVYQVHVKGEDASGNNFTLIKQVEIDN